MSVLFSPAYIKELTDWRRNRIKNYSVRKGVSFEKVVKMLLEITTVDDMLAELDRTCDAEFHSSRKPRYFLENKNTSFEVYF